MRQSLPVWLLILSTIGAIGLVVWSIIAPIERNRPELATKTIAQGNQAQIETAELTDFSELLQKRLQGKPEPAQTSVAQPSEPEVRLPFQLRLTAILFARGQSIAQFTVNGQTKTLRVGESAENVEVIEILQNSVKLNYRDREFVVKLNERPTP